MGKYIPYNRGNPYWGIPPSDPITSEPIHRSHCQQLPGPGFFGTNSTIDGVSRWLGFGRFGDVGMSVRLVGSKKITGHENDMMPQHSLIHWIMGNSRSLYFNMFRGFFFYRSWFLGRSSYLVNGYLTFPFFWHQSLF